jgi:hypothetical protein
MKVHFSAPHPKFGTKNARLSVGHQESSPYYWWWAYLRRNTDYLKCCEKGGKGKLSALYDDFGDVRDESFHKWWTADQRGAKLFGEQPLSIQFKEVTSPEQWGGNWTQEKVLVVAFPLAKSKSKLMGHIKWLLDKRHPGRQGRPALAALESTAKYRLSRNYTIANLQTSLDVYDLWLKSQNATASEKMSYWQIGVALNLSRSAGLKVNSRLSLDRVNARNHLAVVVKRYLNDAIGNIESVSNGVFPALRNKVSKSSVKKNDT